MSRFSRIWLWVAGLLGAWMWLRTITADPAPVPYWMYTVLFTLFVFQVYRTIKWRQEQDEWQKLYYLAIDPANTLVRAALIQNRHPMSTPDRRIDDFLR